MMPVRRTRLPLAENLPPKQESPISRLARIITKAARFKGDAHGLDNGEHAALARLDPDAEFRPIKSLPCPVRWSMPTSHPKTGKLTPGGVGR
jgi:hypothetical protein